MNSQSFCMCGAQPGYRHSADCPFPYYGQDKGEMDRWQDAAEAKHEAELERRYEQDAPLTIADLRAA